MLRKISELDVTILSYINEFSAEKYDAFWMTVTQTSTWIPMFLFFLYVIYSKYGLKKSAIIVISALITVSAIFLFTDAIKEIIMRPRPNNNSEVSQMLRFIKRPSDYSFFSGHSSNSAALSTLVVFILKHQVKWAYIFYIWPLMFAFSRLYIAVHYPSDVLAGLLTGFLFGYIAYRLTYFYFLRDDYA